MNLLWLMTTSARECIDYAKELLEKAYGEEKQQRL